MGYQRVVNVKIYYHTDHLDEAAIVAEIETWEGVEDIVVLGNADASNPINEEDWDT